MTATLVEGPTLPSPFQLIEIQIIRSRLVPIPDLILENGLRRNRLACLQCTGVTIQRRAIRADNFAVGTHVQKHMRMIKRRTCACTLKFVCADFYNWNAHIIVKLRCAGARHLSVCLRICAVHGVSCVDGTAFGYSRYSGDSINRGTRPSP